MLGALAGIFRPALPDPAVSAGIRSAGKNAAGCWGFAVTPPMCSRTVLIQGAVALRQYPKSLFGAHGRAPTCSFSDACSLALHIGYAAQTKCVFASCRIILRWVRMLCLKSCLRFLNCVFYLFWIWGSGFCVHRYLHVSLLAVWGERKCTEFCLEQKSVHYSFRIKWNFRYNTSFNDIMIPSNK